MEFVVTPLLLGLIGWLLDARLGTQPLFTVAFAIMGIIGVGVSHYFRYMARMTQEDEGKPWARRAQ
jgi:F0F1-type ATP synthase assembly protein I